jgi:hypothetical protein
MNMKYSGTSVHERLSSRTNRFTNKFSEKKTSRVTNGVLSNEHASRQQRLATSWEYRRESVSCCVTFAQYTSLFEFTVPSLVFHFVLWVFFCILLNKTPWDQRNFGLRTFRVTNGLQERIKFVNRGSTVPGGALNLSYTKLPRPWSPWRSSPSRKNPHGTAGNRTLNIIISSQKL